MIKQNTSEKYGENDNDTTTKKCTHGTLSDTK